MPVLQYLEQEFRGYKPNLYLTYVQAQLTELLSNYGTIPGIWFDGGAWHFSSVSKPNYYPWASYKARETFIRALQPNIVIVDNNHLEDVTTSDINEFEQTTPDGILYCSEWCDPIRQDDSWFYLTPTSAPETAAFLLGNLATAQSLNAAYLIAITPDTTGVIPSAQVTVMGQIGAGH